MRTPRKRWTFISVLACVVAGMSVLFLVGQRAKLRAQSMSCASSMVSITCAGRMWAADHGGKFPTDFFSMGNELVTPKVLSCLPERRTALWSTLTPSNCTYEIVSPDVSDTASNSVFIRCTVHGHLGYSDMTVFDGVRRRGKYVWQ
jgi:hypothetical protein